MPKVILHLCADIGSDSRFYQLDPEYKVIKVGKDIGVANFNAPDNVHGVIANPVCTEFSTANYHNGQDADRGMLMVENCLAIIRHTQPEWWVMENPATGRLRDRLGPPKTTYQPWEYGSPWTKRTALWGRFDMPTPLYYRWEDVPKNPDVYARPNRRPSLAFLHKSAIQYLPEFAWCRDKIKTDADLRSLCAPGFAQAFKECNP